ncbi:MAG: hypothetical protein E6I89_08480, partial [Chloroflexi bacterium]
MRWVRSAPSCSTRSCGRATYAITRASPWRWSRASRRSCGIVGRVTEDIGALQKRLRSGSLPHELLKPGHEVALRSGDRQLTRDELRTGAGQVAGGLSDLGVRTGDRIALYAANSLDWVVAYLGVQRVGACAVMMNPDYHSAEAEHILHDSEPTAVIADADRAAIVARLGLRVIPLEEVPKAATPPMPDLTPDTPAAILYTSGTTGRPKGAVL